MKKKTFDKMRNPTFDKKKGMTVCLYCRKLPIAIKDWNKPCSRCKKKKRGKKNTGVSIGSRVPAAIIETENGQKVFVDKFGRETENPGYDLKNDSRGWKFNGKVKKDRDFIK